jgi:hypothetical protein
MVEVTRLKLHLDSVELRRDSAVAHREATPCRRPTVAATILADTCPTSLTHASDIAFALENLSYRNNGFATIRIDREVSAFLIDALRRNHGPA